MRALSFFVASAIILTALPSVAGNLTLNDNRGRWQPTGCTVPTAPAALPKDSEAKANDLNARMAAHNQFVTAVDEYMQCVSKEAGKDSENAGLLINKSAQAIFDKLQADIDTSAKLVSDKSKTK